MPYRKYHFWQACCFCKAQLSWNGEALPRFHWNEIRISTAGDQGTYTFAPLPAGNTSATLGNNTGDFKARDFCRYPWRRRVLLEITTAFIRDLYTLKQSKTAMV